jgi:hypothetical protein
MSTERLVTCTVRWGAISTLAGGIASIWAYFVDAQTFFSAWLAGYYFWLSMPLGALALLLIWDLTGGKWEAVARVPLEAMAATMPLFILLFLPLLAALTQLYPWARPEGAAGLHNTWYLNLTFFYARVGVYFAVWNGLAAWRTLIPGLTGVRPHRAQWVSGLGLMLLLYTVSYAGIDWVLSTEPHWFSSMFGMIACSSVLIAGLCATVLLLLVQSSLEERRQPALRSGMAGLAAILLAAVIFWGYASFCQWLIVWEENLRAEIGWYLERWSQPWGAVIYTLVAAHFLIPFLALVWGPTKRKPTVVGPICILLLLAEVVYVWWLLLPGLPSIHFTWIHPAVVIGMGGVWLLTLAGILRLSSRRAALVASGHEGLMHG